jgi:hypothetical protein
MNNDWGKGLCGSGGVMERRMISGRRFAFGMATGNLFLKLTEEMLRDVSFGTDIIICDHFPSSPLIVSLRDPVPLFSSVCD